jgi:hypothetical protein
MGIWIADGKKSFLKFPGVLPEIMPKTSEVHPVTGVEVVCEGTGHFCNVLQMIFKAVPMLRGSPFSGMGIVFICHGIILGEPGLGGC